jgi:transcription elongation factor GreA
MSAENVLTRQAYEKLRKELEHLKGTVRLQVAEAIREAKSHGDLRENAAYHEAKLNQARLDSRIAEMEKMLQLAKVVETNTDSEVADMGATVKLQDLEWGDELEITLVSSFEADPSNDLISVSSPMGSAIVGKSVGDEVEFESPAGKQRYKIISFKFGE